LGDVLSAFALEEDGALIAQHMRRFLIKHVRPTNK
jgi:hypothetical protein